MFGQSIIHIKGKLANMMIMHKDRDLKCVRVTLETYVRGLKKQICVPPTNWNKWV